MDRLRPGIQAVMLEPGRIQEERMMAEMAATWTIGGILIEQHCTLLVAGDRHLVGRVPPGRWTVTGAVVEETDGLLITHVGRRYILGEAAAVLEPEAEAVARGLLKGLCCYEAEQIDAIIGRLRETIAGRT
ncbi:hypothetical protein VY88_33065 [Azospirillum thiophilum]|nr:hypothetical protein VY88_33065 [Azospirillum thiophilum]